MALINDPDDLRVGTEVTINTATRTFTLNAAGNLSNDGVTLQALYSFFKLRWKADNTLIMFPFPMVAITPEQFEFVAGWKPANDATRKFIRTGGWAEVDAAGVRNREYLGVVTLGAIDAADRAYYAFASDATKTDFAFTGPVNEAIQTFGDSTNGAFDKRSERLTLFIRVQGKTFGQVTTSEIGVNTITYKVERFPLSEAADLKIQASDAVIAAQAPYNGMSISYRATPLSSPMGSNSYPFGIIVNANGGTAQQVYEFIQYQLRRNTNINAATGTINGFLASALARFVGDRLDTLFANNSRGGGDGVFIQNLSAVSINDVRFVDNAGVYRTFPFVAAGVINFSQTLQADAAAFYRVFVRSTFATAGGILVNDAAGVPISGDVTGRASVSFTFDYDGNIQAGRTPGTDLEVTVVASGLNSAQYVVAEATIGRTTANSVTLVSALERNYSNP